MAGDLVDAREAAKLSEEYAKLLLQKETETSASDMRRIEEQLATIDAALNFKFDAATDSPRQSRQRQRQRQVIGAEGATTPLPVLQPQVKEFKSKSVQVPAPQEPTKEFHVNPPRSAGRTISSPRAIKKARTQPHNAKAGVPKLKTLGRNVMLEEDDVEEDSASSTARLLKLVDQDFAEVAASRDHMRSMFDIPATRARKSPRRQFSPSKKEKVVATHAVRESAGADAKPKPLMLVEAEKITGLPSLFPPVSSSIKTPRM